MGADLPQSRIVKIEQFRALAATHRVIPVSRALLADDHTAIGIYHALAQERPGTFLLESAEHGRSWSRYSFIGVNSRAVLTEVNGAAQWRGNPPAGVPQGESPLEALRQTVEHLRSPRLPELPPLTGGMIGYLGYDTVRRLERLPSLAEDDLQIPEMSFLLASDLAVLDHHSGQLILIANAINWDGSDERVDEAFADALARLDQMESSLKNPPPATADDFPADVQPVVERGTSTPEFIAAVEQAKEEIRAGEAFQIVLSQRFAIHTSATALDIYRVLRANNPSPYMFLIRFDDGLDVVGSSPEALVKVTGDHVMVHPIAGTRPRHDNVEIDAALSQELLADPKERAEHLMLVDLGRNDLGRVCAPGSVDVVDFMSIERYSHVMHIVSTVVGRLDSDKTSFDALLATFPAGTLSGAPKPRAMEIIEKLEKTRRGLYGGVVGYLDFAGDLDVAIAIRTALLKEGVAYVQAGAGVVADSDPIAEDAECQNKAAAVLRAIATASAMR